MDNRVTTTSTTLFITDTFTIFTKIFQTHTVIYFTLNTLLFKMSFSIWMMSLITVIGYFRSVEFHMVLKSDCRMLAVATTLALEQLKSIEAVYARFLVILYGLDFSDDLFKLW